MPCGALAGAARMEHAAENSLLTRKDFPVPSLACSASVFGNLQRFVCLRIVLRQGRCPLTPNDSPFDARCLRPSDSDVPWRTATARRPQSRRTSLRAPRLQARGPMGPRSRTGVRSASRRPRACRRSAKPFPFWARADRDARHAGARQLVTRPGGDRLGQGRLLVSPRSLGGHRRSPSPHLPRLLEIAG